MNPPQEVLDALHAADDIDHIHISRVVWQIVGREPDGSPAIEGPVVAYIDVKKKVRNELPLDEACGRWSE